MLKVLKVISLVFGGMLVVGFIYCTLVFIYDFLTNANNIIGLLIVIAFLIAPFVAIYFAIDWLLERNRQKRKAERDKKFEEMLLGIRKFGDYDD